jgi:hypothetical protein
MLQRLCSSNLGSSVLFAGLIGFSPLALAAEYYTIQDEAPAPQEVSWTPIEVMEGAMTKAVSPVLNLLSWHQHTQKLPSPDVPYNRLEQYGTWVRDPADGSCHNTRARVLIRQSEVPVTMSAQGCTVIRGKWLDPYSDRYYSQAEDLDIDHVVPLKNSYTSGAWKWDHQKRCLYANFMANDFHLLAVHDVDNKRKGDKGPDGFMPEDPAYACQYLSEWLKIKLIWNLAMTSAEGEAIEQLVQDNHCKVASLSIKIQDLRGQRQGIVSNMNLCH